MFPSPQLSISSVFCLAIINSSSARVVRKIRVYRGRATRAISAVELHVFNTQATKRSAVSKRCEEYPKTYVAYLFAIGMQISRRASYRVPIPEMCVMCMWIIFHDFHNIIAIRRTAGFRAGTSRIGSSGPNARRTKKKREGKEKGHAKREFDRTPGCRERKWET